MSSDFSRPPLSRPAKPATSAPALTPAQRRTMKFVDATIPPQSPTRIPIPVSSGKPPTAAEAKKLHNEIVQEYRAKHGKAPDIDYVISEVWKRLGCKS
jgi:hypothetical protein